MSYKALLFCPDEKTARVVTQVLSDLEFRVEPCNEPFAAVKKLMAEHFDAIVVDCDNEQNAALLFKSAHNSGSNQASLAVAVVEGQAGVAKAFRIGANLVLTKPINVEQSKGTLRVARGLLRKSDAAKPASAAQSTNPLPRPTIANIPTEPRSTSDITGPKTVRTSLPVQPPPSPIPAMSSSVVDVEEDPTPKLEPTEAALLESMRDPAESKPHAAEPAPTPVVAKEYPWQPIAKPMAGPMATALRHAAEAGAKSEVESPAPTTNEPAQAPHAAMGRSFTTSHASGQAAAAAPAKEEVKVTKPASMPLVEAPTFSSLSPAEEPPSGGSKKIVLIAAIVAVAAAVGYIGWTRIHPANAVPTAQKVSTAPQTAPVRTAPTQSLPPSAMVVSQSQNSLSKDNVPAPAQPVSPLPAQQISDAKPLVSTPAPATKKQTSIVATNTVVRTPASTANDDATDNEPAPIVVKSQAPAPAPAAPAPQESAQPPAPSLVADASNSTAQAISGIVSTPAVSLPTPAQTIKVSQGVSQGLLVKNVQPVYPPLARQMRIQGAVELVANISKNGDITAVKLISGDSALAQAAIDAVKMWKYKPYYLDGQPVEIQTQVTVKFKLP